MYVCMWNPSSCATMNPGCYYSTPGILDTKSFCFPVPELAFLNAQACLSVDIARKTWAVEAKAFGKTVQRREFSLEHGFSTTQSFDIGIGELELKIYVDTTQRAIGIAGRACAFWKCTSFNKTFHY